MEQAVKIISTEHLTHDVLRIVVEKPKDLTFEPGQATDVSINKAGWKEELRPFTFTSLPAEDYLEFTIKTYPSHNGVTQELLSVAPGDELMLHDVYGAITYQGEGIFLAGGAGVTPFIAIFKELEENNRIGQNKLIFANKTQADIIHESKFNALLGDNFVNVLSEEERDGFEHGYITAELIKKHIDQNTNYFYLCGPEPMMEAIEKHLSSLGVAEGAIVKESFE